MTGLQEKQDIRKMSVDQLKGWMAEHGEKAFRAKQIYEWIWKKSANSFAEMTNLSLSTRQLIDEHFVIHSMDVAKQQQSNDGTIKSAFRLFDGNLVEGVLIPATDRMTACVSSQVGCSLTCKFCATGYMDRKRNLEAGEIYDQVVAIARQAQDSFNSPLTNIVYMGMGEPLLNYTNVLKSIEHITSPEGLNMSPRRITVSTAGIAKMIKKLGNLAEALNHFYQKTGNRITFEYIVFNNFNDTLQDAKELWEFTKRVPARVNIIEYNPIAEADFTNTGADKLDKFAAFLEDRGVSVHVRRSRGKDIDAACGQLANKEKAA
jgi:23S rRNA (adenine2503-C2)-methyltransferase